MWLQDACEKHHSSDLDMYVYLKYRLRLFLGMRDERPRPSLECSAYDQLVDLDNKFTSVVKQASKIGMGAGERLERSRGSSPASPASTDGADEDELELRRNVSTLSALQLMQPVAAEERAGGNEGASASQQPLLTWKDANSAARARKPGKSLDPAFWAEFEKEMDRAMQATVKKRTPKRRLSAEEAARKAARKTMLAKRVPAALFAPLDVDAKVPVPPPVAPVKLPAVRVASGQPGLHGASPVVPRARPVATPVREAATSTPPSHATADAADTASNKSMDSQEAAGVRAEEPTTPPLPGAATPLFPGAATAHKAARTSAATKGKTQKLAANLRWQSLQVRKAGFVSPRERMRQALTQKMNEVKQVNVSQATATVLDLEGAATGPTPSNDTLEDSSTA